MALLGREKVTTPVARFAGGLASVAGLFLLVGWLEAPRAGASF